MENTLQNAADKFLRNYADKFTVKDMIRFFGSMGLKISAQECLAVLEECPWVFALEEGTYVTRAGAFTGEAFSIRPTAQEFEQGVLVLGSRCLPFIDSEMISSSLNFLIQGQKLKKKVGSFDSDLAITFFQMYGEEYAPQYIASDPANANLDMVVREFELPNRVSITGIDMSVLVEEYGMQLGDRVVCSVANWDKGIIQLMVLRDGQNKFNRGIDGSAKLLWYENLEKYLMESFERFGPCGSMEEQLANVFFENSRDLCTPLCGSVEEFMETYSRKIGFECFGVETRLWYKGQDVPAVGIWNSTIFENRRNPDQPISFGLPREVLEQYVNDMLYRKDSDLEKLLERMYPDDYVFHKDEKSYILEVLEDFYHSMKPGYNWFADRSVGEVRKNALELYSVVSELVYKIDSTASDVRELPQQELVILTQLYGHIYRILNTMTDVDSIEKDSSAILMSMDGMKWNFEDIRETLESALEKQRVSRFKVIKATKKIDAKKIK